MSSLSDNDERLLGASNTLCNSGNVASGLEDTKIQQIPTQNNNTAVQIKKARIFKVATQGHNTNPPTLIQARENVEFCVGLIIRS